MVRGFNLVQAVDILSATEQFPRSYKWQRENSMVAIMLV